MPSFVASAMNFSRGDQAIGKIESITLNILSISNCRGWFYENIAGFAESGQRWQLKKPGDQPAIPAYKTCILRIAHDSIHQAY
jgi:hypothetical protein